MSLNEDEVSGWYLISAHLNILALETLGDRVWRKLADSESIAAELAKLDRTGDTDPEALAGAAARIFECIADLTGKNPIVEVIRRTNDKLFYMRTLECRLLDDVQDELVAICEFLLDDDREAAVCVITDYHDRRLAIVPELIELSRR